MSEKTVAERLQVKGERRLAVLDAPAMVDETIGAVDRRCGTATADVIVVFVASRANLNTALPKVISTAPAQAIIWIAYIKLSSRLAGDLNRDLIRDMAARSGLETVSQIAIDDDWSALRVKRVRYPLSQ